MTVIIVDDEPKAIELLRGYLQLFSDVEISGTYRNGLKAFAHLQREAVDLVLLDINMPHISGLSLARMIPPDTRIIFTTAYAEFAAESYEVNAVDYLLKPISLERFTRSMAKILAETSRAESDTSAAIVPVKSDGKVHLLRAEKIFFLEKDGNYIHYSLADRRIMARETVRNALDKLPGYFRQCHKSFIVNLNQVRAFDSRELSVGESAVPIGEAFREDILAVLPR